MLGSSSADGALSIVTNSAERLRITSAGKVGIGTNAPATILHLFGSADSEALLKLSSGSNKRNNYIGVNGNATYLKFTSGGPTEGSIIVP